MRQSPCSHRTVAATLILLAVLAGLAGEGRAAEAPPGKTVFTPELTHYLASAEHEQAVLDAARRHNERLPDKCPSMAFSSTGLMAIFAPIRMGADARPVEGAWNEPVTASGCGSTKQFNVLTFVAPGQPIAEVALLPGDTKADPALQRDALVNVYQGAALHAKDCQELIVTGTKFEAWEGEPVKNALHGPNARPWRETWTVWACRRVVDVPIHFVPDERGTGFRVVPREVKLKR